MGKKGTTVEVGLIKRDDERVKDWLKESELDLYSFDVEVINVGISILGFRTLNVLYPTQGGFTIRQIDLREYWILSTSYLSEGARGSIDDIWALDDGEQGEAFNLIQDELEAGQVKQLGLLTEGSTDVGSRPNGPKRLEVEIQNISGTREKMVVTDALGPSGAWTNSCLRGRVWRDGKLPKVTFSMHELGWRIFRIDTILGANLGSSTSHYSEKSQDQNRAWAYVVEAWGKYKKSEVDSITKWEPTAESSVEILDDSDESYPGYSGAGGFQDHWTNRVPSHYQYSAESLSAYYRVRGDDAGQEIFCEQSKILGEPMDMSEVLAYMEKKDEAADKDESDTTAKSTPNDSKNQGDAASSIDSGPLCKCAESEWCNICIEEDAAFEYGFGGIMH